MVGWSAFVCMLCPISWRLQTVQPLGESSSSYFTISSNTFDRQSRTTTVSKSLPPCPLLVFAAVLPTSLTTYAPIISLTSLRIPRCERFGLDPFTYKLFLFFRVYRFRRVPHPELVTIEQTRHPLISNFPYPSPSTHLFAFTNLSPIVHLTI